MSQRLNAILPDDVFEKLLHFSEQEKRTKSQMAAILIEEAITARERDAKEQMGVAGQPQPGELPGKLKTR